ncbi:MAG: hypothetical protein FJ304_00500 [Planctomycetes bacterium]|nr:hypothetical protein [Planctomycetota bacterium]
MSDLALHLDALARYANRPATAHCLRAEPGELFGSPPLAPLMQFAHTVGSRPDLDALLAAVAPMIRASDPFRGATLALCCGTFVEWGADPAVLFPHLLAELPRHLALARRGADFDTDPDAARAAVGLTFLLLATMTTICRRASFRQALRADAAISEHVAALASSHREARFVADVLALTDDLELLVLAPHAGKGFRVRLEAIATCAHLFTLLQALLIDGGHLARESCDADLVAVAHGERAPQQLMPDHARFHFATWGGLDANASGPNDVLAAWVPVEASPREIPTFEGTPVLLVGPNLLGSRYWGSDFFANFHDALRSNVELVEALPAERAAVWLDRLRRARA